MARPLSMTPTAIRSRRARKRKGSRLAQKRGQRVRIYPVPLPDHVVKMMFSKLPETEDDQAIIGQEIAMELQKN